MLTVFTMRSCIKLLGKGLIVFVIDVVVVEPANIM